jgi:beta-N-acetylhexosaminidase
MTRLPIFLFFTFGLAFFSDENKEKTLSALTLLKIEDEVPVVAPTDFDTLSIDEKVKMLVMLHIKSAKEFDQLDEKATPMFFSDSKLLREVKLKKGIGLKIASMHFFDSDLPSNLLLGSTDELDFVERKYEELTDRVTRFGINVVLTQEYKQLFFNGEMNTSSFTQSPYLNQKYWRKAQARANAEGLYLGGIGFFTGLQNNSQSLSSLQTFHFAGLRELARNELSFVQIENEFCSLLDTVPAAFSEKILKDIIREDQGYNGILIGPSLAASPNSDQANLALEGMKAGLDMVVVGAENHQETLEVLSKYFKRHKKRLDEKARKLYEFKKKNKAISSLNDKKELLPYPFAYQATANSLVLLKNSSKVLPRLSLNQPTGLVSNNPDGIKSLIDQYKEATLIVNNYSISIPHQKLLFVDAEDLDLTSFEQKTIKVKRPDQNFVLLIDQADIYAERGDDFNLFDAVIVLPNYDFLSKSLAIQAIFGSVNLKGKLPFYLNPSYPTFSGEELQSINRMKYTDPKYLGLSDDILSRIDSIATNGVKLGAFPGCQVQMAWGGHVVYQKAFGKIDDQRKTDNHTKVIYDLASITKIAGSTVGLMKLQSDKQFSLNSKLGEHLPVLTKDSEYAGILLKDMMAHQAGLPGWIPFYIKTIVSKQPSPELYSYKAILGKSTPVAKDLFILDSYVDTIYAKILAQNLKTRKYLYSDLGYYFVKKIIEKKSNKKMEDFLYESFYQPMGLQTMGYNPLNRFDLDRIAATENDKQFRKQTVHGYVHDPGAAMLGGVCGHAGIFATANDLSILMQMVLNGGYYGGKQYIKPEVIKEYTALQFPKTNRRGAGFDKPKLHTGGGTCADEASPESYGHSGFTGTLTWLDPKVNLNYVFLSNRVNPDAENWKIVKMDIRTDIQSIMYKALKQAKYENYLTNKKDEDVLLKSRNL